MTIHGKRFLFGIVMAVCLTVTAIILKYNGEIYLKGLGIITGLYVAGQTITDSIAKKEGK